jgi:hypothetical protein
MLHLKRSLSTSFVFEQLRSCGHFTRFFMQSVIQELLNFAWGSPFWRRKAVSVLPCRSLEIVADYIQPAVPALKKEHQVEYVTRTWKHSLLLRLLNHSSTAQELNNFSATVICPGTGCYEMFTKAKCFTAIASGKRQEKTSKFGFVVHTRERGFNASSVSDRCDTAAISAR